MSIYGKDDDMKWEKFKDSIFWFFVYTIPYYIILLSLIYHGLHANSINGQVTSLFIALLLFVLLESKLKGTNIFNPPASLGARIKNIPFAIMVKFHEWRIYRLKYKAEAKKQNAMRLERKKQQKLFEAQCKKNEKELIESRRAEMNRLMLEERKILKERLVSGGEVSIAEDQKQIAGSGALSEYSRTKHEECDCSVCKIRRANEMFDMTGYETEEEFANSVDELEWNRKQNDLRQDLKKVNW